LTRSRAGTSVLARVTRALGGLPADADDVTLLALLGPILVPDLGEVAALYVQDEEGIVSLAGVKAAQESLAHHLHRYLEQNPGAEADYAALMEQGRVASVRTPATDALGFAAEIVAPLGGGGEPDALLVIGAAGSADRRKQDADADLATVEVLAALVGAWRTIRDLARREAHLHQQLEAVALAGRELAHRLNNDLTMPVGVVELLLDRSALGAELQEMVEAASKDLTALERHIQEFHAQMRSQSNAPAGPRPPEW
jgi:signal transduction histidine kinase